MQPEWLTQHAAFRHGIPRRHCIANIIRATDSHALVDALFAGIHERRLLKEGKSIIANDGKTLRGTGKGPLARALHVVSADDVEAGVALSPQATQSKGKAGPVARHIIG